MLTQQVKLTWVTGAYTVHYGKHDLIKNCDQPPLDTTCIHCSMCSNLPTLLMIVEASWRYFEVVKLK